MQTTKNGVCKIVHIYRSATVTMHICTVTVAFLYIILILSLYIIKSYFTLLLLFPSNLSNTNISQYSPCFNSLPLPLIFSLRPLLLALALAHSHHHGKECDCFGGFCSPVRRVDQLGVISIDRFWGKFLRKRYGFFSLRC